MAGHHLIVPEVIQTSAMDCGPACLSSLLAGYGIRASYERLREACQTAVDGTSIDTLEEAAGQLGLQTEQIMVPADYLFAFDPIPLPAITVVRLPSNLTHFVVIWNRASRVLQIMDPAVGRTWRDEQEFLKSIYVHRMTVPVAVWREWAASEQFLTPLRRKMSQLGCPPWQIEQLLRTALDDPGWRPLAAVEAAVRASERMVRAGVFRRGREASRIVQHFVIDARKTEWASLPAELWSVQPGNTQSKEEGEEVTVRGVILVTVRGRKDTPKPVESSPANVAAALSAVLEEPAIRPARALGLSLWKKAKHLIPVTALALVLSAASVIVEAVLLRGLVDVFADFQLAGERLAVMTAVSSFILVLLLLDYSVAASLLHLGRRLEADFRLTIVRRLPRIADRYFRSRLSSDMAQRAHSTHRLRLLPAIYSQSLRTTAELLVTAAAIVWIERSALVPTLIVISVSVGVPWLFNPVLRERDLKVRNHVGALTRFYLDAMLGLTPLRAHCAERAFRREHSGFLREWATAVLGLQSVAVLVDGLQMIAGFGFAAVLLRHLALAEQPATALLLLYWGLRVPMLGQDLALAMRQYPAQRNVALRVLEPLNAPVDPPHSELEERKVSPEATTRGIAVRFEGVTVEAAGHVILKHVDLEIAPGTHVGIIGASGAGKSSLVGLLLGLYAPAVGRVLVNGALLTPTTLALLRRETAWVDPAVQLWNRSLLENLAYGTDGKLPDGNLMEDAGLVDLLTALPDGLQTSLGENGGIVSGGEGQRVRMGRAMLKDPIRLVVLDEPFRGLERERRHTLLVNARKHWKTATMLCVTHDIAETVALDRVLVIESGQIVEDGCPRELSLRGGSRFRSMLETESELRRDLWSGHTWRKIRLEAGRIVEQKQSLRAITGRNA